MRVLPLALLVGTAVALPWAWASSKIDKRETACIALNNCGGPRPKPSSSTTTAAPRTTMDPPASTADPPPPPPSSTGAPAPSSTASSGDQHIGKFAVLGDSFASGVAWLVSKRYNYTDSDTCRRYFQAYGPQMQMDGRLGKDAEVHFLACSGSRTDKVRDTQIPNIPLDSSFATMSVGGNDVGFFPVMNACVLRSSSGITDDDCKKEIDAATNSIKNDVPGYKDLYSAVTKLQLTDPKFKLYILGYPHFFNVDTDQCDKASFAYYKDDQGGPFLTKEIRTTINDLVQQMNDHIRDAVKATNDDRIQFVDISPFFGGHRFCEAGINEPYSGGIFTGIDDKAAWLYHFDWNPFHELDQNKSQVTDYPTAKWSCDKKLQDDQDMGATLQCGLAASGVTNMQFAGTLVETQDKGANGTEQDGVGALGGDSGDPGQYGLFQRTFHPTYRGHTAIKDAIFDAMGRK